VAAEKMVETLPKFDEVYKNNSSYVYNLAHRMAGTNSDADDVYQEVFLRVHRFLPQYQGKGLRGWLRQITVNVFCTQFRKRKKEQPIDESIELATSQSDPATSLDERLLGERLTAALATLGPEMRAPMILRGVEQLSYQEIAELLEIPVGTVRSRLARARLQLVRQLEGETNDLQ
jgi:RNA polymerase sigma-70 factor, ECF subfamily